VSFGIENCVAIYAIICSSALEDPPEAQRRAIPPDSIVKNKLQD